MAENTGRQAAYKNKKTAQQEPSETGKVKFKQAERHRKMETGSVNTKNKNKSYMYLFAALILFGSNGFVANKISMSSYGIVFWRVAIGLAVLLVIFFVKMRRQSQRSAAQIGGLADSAELVDFGSPSKKHVAYNFISGIAQGISWLFLFEAYGRAGVGLSTLIYYLGPALVVAVSPIVFGESLTRKKIMCFAAVLVGMLLVNGHGGSGDDFTGVIFAVISAVLFAVMLIFNKNATTVRGLMNSVIQLAGALPAALVFAVLKGSLPVPQSADDLFWILLLGAVNTGIAMFLYLSALGHLSVQTVSVCGYIEPLSALGFSVALLGESLVAVQLLGGFMILAGALFMEVSPRSLFRAAPEHVRIR